MPSTVDIPCHRAAAHSRTCSELPDGHGLPSSLRAYQLAQRQAEYEGCCVLQQRQAKKGRGPRYSNRRNGLIKEEAAGGDTDSYPSQADGSDQVISLMCMLASARWEL